MSSPSTSVLIASCRPAALSRCLDSLAAQAMPADEVIVAWQGGDTATRNAALAAARSGLRVRTVHSPAVGVVPAENAALDAAVGEIVLLIDDDAVAPPDWLARHLDHYRNPRVGAGGGPFTHGGSGGIPLSTPTAGPVWTITRYGQTIG